MADSAKFTVTDGTGSFVTLGGLSLDDFGTVYVGVQAYLPAATEADWLGGAYNDSPLLMWLQYVDAVNFRDSNSDDVYDKWETFYEGAFTGASIADNWHIVEWLREPTNGPGPYSLSIDGTPLFTDTFGPSGTITDALFGAPQQHAAAPALGDIYIARIRIGTSDGSSDILDWDASLVADFSAFTSTTGTVVLASAPSAPPAWGGGDVTPPTRTSLNVSGATVTIVYDEDLKASPGPSPSEFVVTVNGVVRTVTAAAASGTDVTLTLASPISPGDTVLVTYTG